MQTDPVGYKDNFDLYAYVGGDPLNFADPTGLDSEAERKVDPNCYVDCELKRPPRAPRTANDNSPPAANDNGSNNLLSLLASVFGMASRAAIVENAREAAYDSFRAQGAVDEQKRDPKSYVWVARFFGNKSGPLGQSWMPLSELQRVGKNPEAIRERWGIGHANSMEGLVIGLMRTQDVRNPALVTIRPANEWDGYKGGGTEYLINSREMVPVLVTPVSFRNF